MKKLIPVMLGVALAVGSITPAFSQEKKEGTEAPKKGKKKGKKSSDETKAHLH